MRCRPFDQFRERRPRWRCGQRFPSRTPHPCPSPYRRGDPAPFRQPRAKSRPQACLRARQNTGLAERREARRVASASVEPGSGADEASSARPVALRLRRFQNSGPRFCGWPAGRPAPAGASAPQRVVAPVFEQGGAWRAVHLASSSHRDRSVPRAVPRSLPGAGRNPRPQAPTLTQPLAYLRTAAPYG